jgi:glycerophosphoryl diester phosphodiesterase
MNIPRKYLPKNFDLQGHRGCRGLLPENTLQAFRKAIELNVTTLEMDVVISKDKKVVVSHEAFFNHLITLTPDGNTISEKEEMGFNIYQMDYSEIKKFDVGRKIHPFFPRQKKVKAYKPLLSEVIQLAENSSTASPLNYNIEIKSFPGGDKIFHPEVEEFCELVIAEINEHHISERTSIQSFDVRALQYLFKSHPYQKLSYLIENELSPEMNISILGFIPEIYSPDLHLVNENLVQFCKDLNMKIIPWTVNNPEDTRKLINMGVDGIITDFPDVFV